MMTRTLSFSGMVLMLLTAATVQVSAQNLEITGSRALGMGGAFVGLADDSSATWWNPAGLAAGPFLDMALTRAVTEVTGERPARRARVSSFALGTPALGISYYRFRLTEISAAASTVPGQASREEGQAELPVRSLGASQFGITVLQSVLPGVHVGTTLKYVRGTLRAGPDDPAAPTGDLLDRGDDLSGGDAGGRFDLDVGVLAVDGPFSIGAVVRNVREPEFGTEGAVPMKLPRQIRVGAAVQAGRGGQTPLSVAVDADVRRYETAAGDRRVIAFGAEQRLGRVLAVRAGARFNTVGAEDRAATGGISVALRSGLYLDGHIVRGGSADDRGWGVATRVSF